MKNIRKPATDAAPGVEDLLFDTNQYCWWARQLHPGALRRLEQGFEGIFRRSLLQLMPADKLAKHFTDKTGRPTKELYSMAGLLLIAEFRNYTVDETADAYTYDAALQYALDIPRDKQYVCPRTIDNYRKLFRDDELAQNVFQEVTATLIKELEIDISKQRCDSTHVLSNMAVFSRYQLLATAAKRFLHALKKHDNDQFTAIEETLRKRYESSDQRLYFGEVVNPSKVTAEEKKNIITQIGEDLIYLIDRFTEKEAISQLDSYQKMKRVFNEHFEIETVKVSGQQDDQPLSGDTGDNDPPSSPGNAQSGVKPRPCGIAADGGKTNTLQNTSDEDAGFSGHKGSGYQAQIAQTLPPEDKDGQVEGPGIITAVLVESAANYDGDSLLPLLEQQQENGLLCEQMSADSQYGSDQNVCAAADQFKVEIISPVSGASQYPEAKQNRDKPIVHGTKAAEAKARKARLDKRREAQLTEEWKNTYAGRSGIEGLNRALDLTTGFKKLRVRGLKAVSMSLYLKAAGWNILTAATIKAGRARKAAFSLWILMNRITTLLRALYREQKSAAAIQASVTPV